MIPDVRGVLIYVGPTALIGLVVVAAKVWRRRGQSDQEFGRESDDE